MQLRYGQCMTDLARAQHPAEFLTIKIHNYKDDPTGDMISLHGLFTDRTEAEAVAKTLVPDDYNGFLSATVVPLLLGTIEQVADAQRIGWIPDPQAPSPTAAQIAESGRIEQDADTFLSLTTDTDDHLVEGLPSDSSYNDGYEGETRR